MSDGITAIESATALGILRDTSLSPTEQTNRIIWEVFGGDITKVDNWLETTIPQLNEQDKKKVAEVIAIAHAQAEMNYQQNSKYISSRLEDGTLFSGSFEDFSKDLAIAIQTSQHYYKRVELGLNTPEEDTRHDCMCVQLYMEARGSSEKLEEVMSNPDSAKIYVRGQQIFLQMRDQGLFDGKSPEQIEKARHEIFENVEKNRHTLDKIETPSDLASLKELQKFLDYREKNPDIIPKDFKNMTEEQREEFWNENGPKILSEYKQSNPNADLAKLKSVLPDAIAAGKSYNPNTGEFDSSIFDKTYKKVTESFNAKEIADSLGYTDKGNQTRKDILDEFKAKGELSQSTFDKTAKIILPDLKQQFPNLTEAELKAKYASDPEFRKEISKVLEQGVREFDHQHQGIPLNGVSAENKPKFTFSESFADFFKQSNTAEKMTIAGVGAVSPLAGAALAVGSMASDFVEKSPEAKSAFEGLTDKAKEDVKKISEACGCKNKPEKTTPPVPVERTTAHTPEPRTTPEPLAQMKSGDDPSITSSKPATDHSIAQNPQAASSVRGT